MIKLGNTESQIAEAKALVSHLEGMLEQRTSCGDQKVWKLLDRALDEAKSEIDIMRRISTAGRSGRMLANIQWFILRKRQGLRRRLPGWPRVNEKPV